MPAFSYVAKDSTGNLIRATLRASTRADALSNLQVKGLTVVDLHGDEGVQAGQDFVPAATTSKRRRRRVMGRGVPLTELSMFCRQLAISVGSGVALRDALESIGDDLDHPVLSHSLDRVIERLHEGMSFSNALLEQQTVFGPLFVALVRGAEEAGSMAQTLDHLSSYLERSERLERKIKSITAYPVFVAVFFCIVCVIMTLFVLPQFEEIFEGFGSEPPLLTQVVFGTNRFILDHILLIVGAGMVGIGGFVLYGRTKPGRLRIDRLKLNLPFFGTCIRKFAVARFCRNLAMMLRGGVPITTALEITSSVSGNKVLEISFLEARERVIHGSSISASLSQDPNVPRLLVRMVDVGEDSGQLPEVLEKLSDVYEDQVEGSILVATALFEPIIICFFGAVILMLILAIYMPIFSVGTSVK